MAVGGGPAAAVEAALACFAVAMALHFVVNDYGLDEDHKGPHRRVGRWVLVGAVLVGYLVGAATEISEVAIAALTAFLAGGVILNVLKEEVPSERQSRSWAFAVGLAGYAALLLTVWSEKVNPSRRIATWPTRP